MTKPEIFLDPCRSLFSPCNNYSTCALRPRTSHRMYHGFTGNLWNLPASRGQCTHISIFSMAGKLGGFVAVGEQLQFWEGECWLSLLHGQKQEKQTPRTLIYTATAASQSHSIPMGGTRIHSGAGTPPCPKSTRRLARRLP